MSVRNLDLHYHVVGGDARWYVFQPTLLRVLYFTLYSGVYYIVTRE